MSAEIPIDAQMVEPSVAPCRVGFRRLPRALTGGTHG